MTFFHSYCLRFLIVVRTVCSYVIVCHFLLLASAGLCSLIVSLIGICSLFFLIFVLPESAAMLFFLSILRAILSYDYQFWLFFAVILFAPYYSMSAFWTHCVDVSHRCYRCRHHHCRLVPARKEKKERRVKIKYIHELVVTILTQIFESQMLSCWH